jgi:hypothetical protein
MIMRNIKLLLLSLICISLTACIDLSPLGIRPVTNKNKSANFIIEIENKTQKDFTISCKNQSDIEDRYSVFFYLETWDNLFVPDFKLSPDEKKRIFVGTHPLRRELLGLYFSSYYLVEDMKFQIKFTELSLSGETDTAGCFLELIWHGSGDFVNYSAYYEHQFTGSFILDKTITSDSQKELDFNVYGKANYGSERFPDRYILTSDECYNKEAGYYSLEILPSDEIVDNKLKLYIPPGKN